MKRRDLLALAGGASTTLFAGPANATSTEEVASADADDENTDTVEIDVLIR